MFKKSNISEYTEVIRGVQLKTLVHGDQTLLTEVRLEKGAVIPPHSHPHEQTGYLVSGQIDFLIAGEHYHATSGDSWNIASAVEHSATALEKSVVVEVFSPVRGDYLSYYTPDD